MSKLLNFRAPDDLQSVIEARAKEPGMNQTRVILDALRFAFGLSEKAPGEVPTAVSSGDLQSLIERLTTLEESVSVPTPQALNDPRVLSLEERLASLERLSQKVEELEVKLAAS